MKNLIFIVVILLSINLFGQEQQGKKMSKIPEKEQTKQSTKKVTYPKINPETPSAFAFLLISTDLDVEVSVNFKDSHTILASIGGKEIPLLRETNIVKVTPMDGGNDGFKKSITIEKGKTEILDIEIGKQRLATSNNKNEKQADLDALKLKADMFFKAGNYAEARGIYSNAFDLNPNDEFIQQRILNCDKAIEDEKNRQAEAERQANRLNQQQEEQKRKVANCPLCYGSGITTKRVQCPTCNGNRQTVSSVTCDKCNGNKKVCSYCPNCNGYNKITCHNCSGKGKFPNPRWDKKIHGVRPWEHPNVPEFTKCRVCGGSGKEKCNQCTGKRICHYVQGGASKTLYPCDKCRSRGTLSEKVTCWNCSGSGGVEEKSNCSHNY